MIHPCHCPLHDVPPTWSYLYSMCLVWPRDLLLLRRDWTYATYLQRITTWLPMIQSSLALLSNLSSIRPHCISLQHATMLPVKFSQVWYPWNLMGGNVTTFFALFLLSSYFCYHFIFVIVISCLLSLYDLDSFLLLLSTTDNSYVGFGYV